MSLPPVKLPPPTLGTFYQGSDFHYTAKLETKTGVVVPASALVSLVLTVTAEKGPLPAGGPVVNNLLHVNILNDGVRGVVDALGNLTLDLLARLGDMAIVTPPSAAPGWTETHVLLFEWVTTGGEDGVWTESFQVAPVSRL